MRLALIDFTPVIFAGIMSVLGLGLAKALVYMHKRESRLRASRGRH